MNTHTDKSSLPVDLTGNPNLFPHTGIALVTRILADRVNWLAVVDQWLPWDRARSRISPGIVLLMLVINVLTQHNPLYEVESWAQTLPLALLWGESIAAHQFNDDALGRVLEDLADHGRTLLATLGPRMQAVQGTGPRLLHSDTTAFALFGDYPNADTGPTAPVALTWGHTKDHRPDLRQIMAGLTVDEQGQVLGATMLSGNQSDKAWHPQWLDQLARDFPEDFWKGSYYIADSALMSEPSLQKIRALGMHWLGRLPTTFGLCHRLKDQAWTGGDPWTPLGPLARSEKKTSARYMVQTFDTTLYNQSARAFVYHSEALDKKKEHTLQRTISQEAEKIEKASRKLAKHVFPHAEDATVASELLRRTTKIRWHAVEATVVSQNVPLRKRGRRKAGTEPEMMTQYTVQWHWTGPTAEMIQEERERQSTFVLMTSDRTCDARQALLAYKEQDQDEHGFRWEKSPVHLTAFFLEKPARVVGLGYVLLLALQFARFMRAIVREAMKDQPVLELPNHRKIAQPSEKVILDALRILWVERRTDEETEWYQWTHVESHVWRILEMLQIPIQHRFEAFPGDPSG